MKPRNIRLKLGEKSISIGIEMFSGVLADRIFTGENCYLQLLDFLKMIGSNGTFEAEIDIA